MRKEQFNREEARKYIAEMRFGIPGLAWGRLESPDAIAFQERYWLTHRTIDYACKNALLRACDSKDQEMSLYNWINSFVREGVPIEAIEKFELLPRIKKNLRCLYRLMKKGIELKELGINAEFEALKNVSDVEIIRIIADYTIDDLAFIIEAIEDKYLYTVEKLILDDGREINYVNTGYSYGILEERETQKYQWEIKKANFWGKNAPKRYKDFLIKSKSIKTNQIVWVQKTNKVPKEANILSHSKKISEELKNEAIETINFYKELSDKIHNFARSSIVSDEILNYIEIASQVQGFRGKHYVPLFHSILELDELYSPLYQNDSISEPIFLPFPIENHLNAILHRELWHEEGSGVYKSCLDNGWHIEHYEVTPHNENLGIKEVVEDQSYSLHEIDESAIYLAKLQLIFSAYATRYRWDNSFFINVRDMFRFFNFDQRTDIPLREKFSTIKKYVDRISNQRVRITRQDGSLVIESQLWTINIIENKNLYLMIAPGDWLKAFINGSFNSLIFLPIDALESHTKTIPFKYRLILNLVLRRGGTYNVQELFEISLANKDQECFENNRDFRRDKFNQLEVLVQHCIENGWRVKGNIPVNVHYQKRLKATLNFKPPSLPSNNPYIQRLLARYKQTNLAYRLKALRTKKNWTQSDLLVQLKDFGIKNLYQSKISRIEGGKALSRQDLESIQLFTAYHLNHKEKEKE
jgi:hypothetical protein